MLWLIGSLSRVFRLPFDPQLIRQQFPPPYSRTSLIAALQALDFKVGETVLDEEGIATLERMPFPVVAFVREDEMEAEGVSGKAALSPSPSPAGGRGESAASADHIAEQEAPPRPSHPALLIKADEERVLFFRAGAEQPETVPLAEFTQHFRNDILLVARDTAQTAADLEEEQAASAQQPPAPGHTPFGFRWFVLELMKHKRIWRDILIASLAIQLVGGLRQEHARQDATGLLLADRRQRAARRLRHPPPRRERTARQLRRRPVGDAPLFRHALRQPATGQSARRLRGDRAACKMAEIHAVIEQLSQGYQTPVGENGVGLSGGQRQCIAIARALLKRPRVLIFDESVRNLDQATAEHFAGTINRLKGKVTMLFITHQLPKALQVDEVIEFGRSEAS